MMGLGIAFLVILGLMASSKPASAAKVSPPEPTPPPPPPPPPDSVPPPVPGPPPPPAPPIAPTPSNTKYVVKSGDTGEKIALTFTGSKGRWPELVTANPSLKDPTYGLRIFAGQTINLPPSWVGLQTPPVVTPVSTPVVSPIAASTTAAGKYLVKSGDTGEKIAFAFTGIKGRWPELVTANPSLKDPTYGLRIFAGQTINLPASWIQQPAVVSSGRRWVV